MRFQPREQQRLPTANLNTPLALGAFDRFNNALDIIVRANIPAEDEFVTITVWPGFARGMIIMRTWPPHSTTATTGIILLLFR
jgi:hypothetical protein